VAFLWVNNDYGKGGRDVFPSRIGYGRRATSRSSPTSRANRGRLISPPDVVKLSRRRTRQGPQSFIYNTNEEDVARRLLREAAQAGGEAAADRKRRTSISQEGDRASGRPTPPNGRGRGTLGLTAECADRGRSESSGDKFSEALQVPAPTTTGHQGAYTAVYAVKYATEKDRQVRTSKLARQDPATAPDPSRRGRKPGHPDRDEPGNAEKKATSTASGFLGRGGRTASKEGLVQNSCPSWGKVALADFPAARRSGGGIATGRYLRASSRSASCCCGRPRQTINFAARGEFQSCLPAFFVSSAVLMKLSGGPGLSRLGACWWGLLAAPAGARACLFKRLVVDPMLRARRPAAGDLDPGARHLPQGKASRKFSTPPKAQGVFPRPGRRTNILAIGGWRRYRYRACSSSRWAGRRGFGLPCKYFSSAHTRHRPVRCKPPRRNPLLARVPRHSGRAHDPL